MLSKRVAEWRAKSEEYVRCADVRARYGNASDMWIHRRLNDDSGFPKPVYFGRLRYWRLSELIAWERKCARGPALSKKAT